MINCKCGGELKAEGQPEGIESPEEFIIGRCCKCGKPYTFSIPMWNELIAVEESV